MKRIAMIVIIMLVVSAYAFADDMYILCRPDDYVNVRAFPSTNAETVGQLDCGDHVETDGTTRRDRKGRTWFKVLNFEGDAWVCSMYLQETPVVVATVQGYVSARGRTAVRRSPGGKRIKWLRCGDEITIYAMSDEWALTTKGYIMTEMIDIERQVP